MTKIYERVGDRYVAIRIGNGKKFHIGTASLYQHPDTGEVGWSTLSSFCNSRKFRRTTGGYSPEIALQDTGVQTVTCLKCIAWLQDFADADMFTMQGEGVASVDMDKLNYKAPQVSIREIRQVYFMREEDRIEEMVENFTQEQKELFSACMAARSVMAKIPVRSSFTGKTGFVLRLLHRDDRDFRKQVIETIQGGEIRSVN